MARSRKITWFRRIPRIAAVLGLIVVVVGAWVRLTDAGLGCPDWPGEQLTSELGVRKRELRQLQAHRRPGAEGFKAQIAARDVLETTLIEQGPDFTVRSDSGEAPDASEPNKKAREEAWKRWLDLLKKP